MALPLLLAVRFKIILLSLVAPLSFVYLGYRLLQIITSTTIVHHWLTTLLEGLWPGKSGSSDDEENGLNWKLLLLEGWLLLECLFYLTYRRHLKRLQSFYPHHPDSYTLGPRQRFEMFRKCVHSLNDIQEYISGWFLGTPFNQIRRENIREFLAWAFFIRDLGELQESSSGSDEAILRELDQMIDSMTECYGIRFPPGYNPQAKCMRLNLDTMEPRHKPFLYYAILQALSLAFELYCTRVLGFKKYLAHSSPQILLGAWKSGASNNAVVKEKIPYWFRPASALATSETDLQSPIVLIHGIGVGLFGYLNYLNKLLKGCGRPIIMIELPHVSSLMFPIWHKTIEDVPTADEMCDFVERIMIRHGFLCPTPSSSSSATSQSESSSLPQVIRPFATFIGHSMGSTVLAWIIKRKPHLVRKAIFIDPVCFLLHLPDIAYNFVYRKPKTFVEWLLWWFASRELYVTWTLNRCFYWFQNILFANEIPHWCHVSVVIVSNMYYMISVFIITCRVGVTVLCRVPKSRIICLAVARTQWNSGRLSLIHCIFPQH